MALVWTWQGVVIGVIRGRMGGIGGVSVIEVCRGGLAVCILLTAREGLGGWHWWVGGLGSTVV